MKKRNSITGKRIEVMINECENVTGRPYISLKMKIRRQRIFSSSKSIEAGVERR